MEECPFCFKSVEDGTPVVCLGEKGCRSILSTTCGKDNSCQINVKPGSVVHVQCRKDFTRPSKKIDVREFKVDKRYLRTDTEQFDFKSKCIFCTTPAKLSHNSRKRSHDTYPVRTLDFQDKIIKICQDRNDQWAKDVQLRLSQVLDLPAADAMYHQACSVNFRTQRNVPKAFNISEQGKSAKEIKSPGRPPNNDQSDAFQKVIEFIENSEDASLTISDLVKKMSAICGDRCYSTKHMKKKILDHFGDSVIVSSTDGKHDIVTLKQSVYSIVNDFYQTSSDLSNDDKKIEIIQTAAKLIKADINSLVSRKDIYPTFTDISSVEKNVEFLPNSLRTFLTKLLSGKNSLKIAAIGQSIIQSCRPKAVMSPLQLGLSVQLHHHFGSRHLIDTLNSLGFCCSYYEVQKYEANAAAILSTTIPCQGDSDSPFLQFSADNVDHNLGTLDGHNTFHGMGIIAMSTPGSDVSVQIPRIEVDLNEVSSLSKIDIRYFIQASAPQSLHTFCALPEISPSECDSTDMLCKLVWPVRQNRPSWSGFMQTFAKTDEEIPRKATVTFMPMIDLSPTDETCIFSTLHFVCEQSKRYGKTPVLTFDQPLYQKAMNIILVQEPSSPLKTIVLRLGAFHTEMSFLGCIGHVMTGSGLHEVLESVYATNAVTHMMSGKAVQRAARGHMLVDNALTLLLLEKGTKAKRPTETNEETRQYDDILQTDTRENSLFNTADITLDSDLRSLAAIFDDFEKGSVSLESILESEYLKNLLTLVLMQRQSILDNRTSKLWLQYMDMVEILQQFIRAERTGNWDLHLRTIRKMLPYFAASGHNLYLKSAYLYLQCMLQLRKTNPDVYSAFMSGSHVIRRSERYWAGLSTDLVIEQVLMRSLKSTGGLTRGRGLNENQRTLWLLSMPACLQMNNAMQEVTDTIYRTSEQHREAGKSRILRDSKDLNSILTFLRERTPFNESDTKLKNIETGVVADAAVNVDVAEEIGEAIVKSMCGNDAGKFTFKRSLQVTRMSDKSDVKVLDEWVHIDTQLLFQRLTTAAHNYVDDISELFRYELAGIPSSLFDNSGLPREPQKAALADALWKQGDCVVIPNEIQTSHSSVVVDGGSLLQRIPWSKGRTYGEICKTYSEYLCRQFTDNNNISTANITIVFDGYKQRSSTKDVTHLRRSKGRVGAEVKFMIETPCRMNKDIFLSNDVNKQNFIFMLGEQLTGDGFSVFHDDEDADLLIAKTAVKLAKTSTVTLIGEDTDILVLLCHYFSEDLYNITFKSASKRFADKGKVWDIRKATLLYGEEMCRLLPLLHALTGCDTTSRIFGIGKPSVLKLFKKSSVFRQQCVDFLLAENKFDILRIGEQLIISLYDEKFNMSLDCLRFHKFASKVASSSVSVQVQSLPPTSDAAGFHSLRVYHQSKLWMGVRLNPMDFGWCIVHGTMMPIKTSLPPAPEKLLQIIHCNCKTNCDSKKCTCRKHGLECSSACGNCRGVSCSNSQTLVEGNELDEEL